MTFGIVLIGAGLIGRRRAEALRPGARLVAIVDLDRSRALDLAGSLDYEVLATDSLEKGLSSPGANVAIISTVHSALGHATVAALKAGCHVLVEKPGAHTLAGLLKVHEVALTSDRQVRVGFNHRFHPAILKAKELIDEGDYGDFIYIRGRYGHGGRLGYEKEWRADKAVSGGGELLDQGSHLIDLTRFFVGEVDLAFAEISTDYWRMSVEDNAYLALRPKAGGFAWLHASWTEWKNLFSFEIAFHRAKLEIFGLGGSYGTERLVFYEMLPELGPPATSCWEWPGADKSWQYELQDVFDGFSGKDTIGADLQDCIAAFHIVEKAYAHDHL